MFTNFFTRQRLRYFTDLTTAPPPQYLYWGTRQQLSSPIISLFPQIPLLSHGCVFACNVHCHCDSNFLDEKSKQCFFRFRIYKVENYSLGRKSFSSLVLVQSHSKQYFLFWEGKYNVVVV